MFFALQLDRGNITQALSDNMLTDLGLSTNDYNYGMTIFYVSFLAAELPSQMISKKLGPDIWSRYNSSCRPTLTVALVWGDMRCPPSEVYANTYGWLVPIQMVSWSIVACSQSRLTGRSTFYLTRALLGLIEGGFIPDVVLYLSYFYKSKELPIRLSFFWGAYISTNIISAFLAFGFLHVSVILLSIHASCYRDYLATELDWDRIC
jgi:MFS family permease